MSAENKELVHQFYLNDISRLMPSARDTTINVTDTDGVHKSLQKHMLDLNQQDRLKAFKGKHPDVKIEPIIFYNHQCVHMIPSK